MYVREVVKSNGSVQIVIVESVRDGKNVRQKQVRNMGTHKNPEQIAIIRKAAEDLIPHLMNEREPILPGLDPAEYFPINKRPITEKDNVNLSNIVEEHRSSHGIDNVLGSIYNQLELLETINGTKKDDESNEILKTLVLERVRDPVSKLKTSQQILTNSNKDLPVQKIYRLMDKLPTFENVVKKKIVNSTLTLLNQNVNLLLFDVTTLYFESFKEDPLRQFGFSKDCKFKETQIVLALVTTDEGLPITYELFPGKTSEAKTLVVMIENLKNKMHVSNITLVADRAMFSDNNLSVMETLGINYVVAARLKSFSNLNKEEIFNPSGRSYSEENWHKEINSKERRIIINYSQTRAEKDKKDRERLIERIKKQLDPRDNSVQVKDLIKNGGTKKYLKIERGKQRAILDENKINDDMRWDGIHGVITNRTSSCEEILLSYRKLWRIEESFRINKTDLKMRPIFHWKPRRIHAHILICFMAFSVTATLRYHLNKCGIKLSINKIKEELARIQTSILYDKKTHRRYAVPSKRTELQDRILKAVGITLEKNICAVQ